MKLLARLASRIRHWRMRRLYKRRHELMTWARLDLPHQSPYELACVNHWIDLLQEPEMRAEQAYYDQWKRRVDKLRREIEALTAGGTP